MAGRRNFLNDFLFNDSFYMENWRGFLSLILCCDMSKNFILIVLLDLALFHIE